MPVTTQPSKMFAEDICKYFCGLPPEKKIVILVSGGSSLAGMKEFFKHALTFDQDASLKRITISLIDERYDENPHHGNSNFVSLMSLDPIEKMQRFGTRFKPVLRRDQSPELLTQAMNDWFEEQVADPNVVVIGVFGAGANYHTAGIVPHAAKDSVTFEADDYVFYSSKRLSIQDEEIDKRITLSFSGIKKLDHKYLYMVGEEKAGVLNTLTLAQTPSTPEDIARKPVLCLLESGSLAIYSDQLQESPPVI